MALTYCTSCLVDHEPGDHRQTPSTPPTPRGRHLAPKPSKPAKPPRPSAEQLGTSTATLLRHVGSKTSLGISGLVSTLRDWGSQTASGLREAIDLGGLSGESEGSRRIADRPQMASSPRASSVGLLERDESDPGLEFSMLESLGFYSDDTALVITLPESRVPGIAPTLPPPDARSQVPDLEIKDWHPHVIARSRLGGSRLSSLAILGLAVTLILLMALVASLLRAPADTAVRQSSKMSEAATELAGSLSRLDAVMAAPSGEVAESTSLLLAVDRSARQLFDLAASLPEDNLSRQAAIGAAQSALAMEAAVGDALNYRVVLQPLWDSPQLAGVIDSTEAASLLATWQIELSEMLESLPSNPALEAHAVQVATFVENLDGWRIDYLDALTAGNTVAAGAAEADLEGQLALLAQAGEETLGAIFAAADTERSRLIRALDALAA